MAYSWNGEPKGFRNTPQTATPIKTGGAYTSGTWKGSLINVARGRFGGYLLYQTTTYPGTGKNITLDFACFGGPNYFNFQGQGTPSVTISIQFYSVVTGGFDSNWYNLGTYSINNTGASMPTKKNNYGANSPNNIAYRLYNNYSTFGSYKPACGITYSSTGITGAGKTYAEYVEAMVNASESPTTWDPNQGYYAYVGVLPFGVRYISNNGKWSSNRNTVNPDGVIQRNWRVVRNLGWAQENEDGGNTPSNYKTFLITPDIIRAAHGTVTGVTAFRLKFQIYDDNIFYFPSTWYDNWTMIDNPQLGLLDYGPANTTTDWPPRFDAKVYHIDGNGRQTEVAAQYASRNNEWGLF